MSASPWLRYGVFVLLVFALLACERQPEASTTSSNQTVPRRQVRSIAVREGSLSATRNTSVTIEASQESQVAAKVNGQITAIVQREGAKVAQGDTILELDDRDFLLNVRNAELAVEAARISLQQARRASEDGEGQAGLQLQSAQSSLELARKQYEEAQALFNAGGVSLTDVTALEAQYNQALSAVRQAEDGLNRAARADEEDLALLEVQLAQARSQLTQAQDMLSDTIITAPFAGEIADLYVEEGEFMGAGSPAFRIVSLDNQQGRFSVSPEDAIKLQQNPEITFRYGGNRYPATIVRSSSASSQQRLVEMVARLEPVPEGLPPIPAGSVAQLDYTLQLAEGLLAPTGAVSTQSGKTYVFRIDDGTTVRQDVTVLAESGGEVALTGLEAGDEIVYPLPADLRDGIAVEVNRSSP